MPCGIPDQAWPGGYGQIDSNNGLRYDTTTGKLWAKPDDVHYVAEGDGSWTTHGTAVFQYGQHLRIAWSPLWGLTGSPGAYYEVSKSPVLTYTNASSTELFARPTIGVPANEWMLGWSMVRCRLRLELLMDTGSGLTLRWADEWTPHPHPFTQYNYDGGDINARIQGEPLFMDNIPAGPGIPAVFDSVSAGQKTVVRFPARSVDPTAIAPSATPVTMPKNSTWRWQSRIVAVGPDTSIFNIDLGGGASLPYYHYLWGAADLVRPVDLSLNIHTKTS